MFKKILLKKCEEILKGLGYSAAAIMSSKKEEKKIFLKKKKI